MRGVWWRGGVSDKKVEVVHFGNYKIQNGCNGDLESESRGMSQANVDLGLLQETNITDGVYAQ